MKTLEQAQSEVPWKLPPDAFCQDQLIEDGEVWCVMKLCEGYKGRCGYKRIDLTRPYGIGRIAPQGPNPKPNADAVCQDFEMNKLVGDLPENLEK